MSPASTVVSCPGKVLLAGGYLVLEPEYAGLVVGTASRFYTVVRDAEEREHSAGNAAGPSRSPPFTRITVHSPQFIEATWTYNVVYGEGDSSMRIEQAQDGSPRNGFVQDALQAALKVSIARGKSPQKDLLIDIVGDNDFYSQDRTGVHDDPPPFVHLRTTLSEVHKTGLGSSAAMVSSLVAALLIHLKEGSSAVEDDPEFLQLLHNTAQYAHSKAQGKVGSGFDVSAAIYGSQLYRRFSPACLQTLLETDDPEPSVLLDGLSPSNIMWKQGSSTAGRVDSFTLPPHTTMLLADVDAGSNTPSMVKSVLKWKASDPESSKRWNAIASNNDRLATIFRHLVDASHTQRDLYNATVQQLAMQNSSQWDRTNDVSALFCDARDCIKSIRLGMKEMGDLAGVPIEPDEQTRLLNGSTEECNGVIGAGVPGAGGYDALWVLVLDPVSDGVDGRSKAEVQINELWNNWSELSVKALSSKAKIRGSLAATVEQQPSGLRLQVLEEVQGLQNILGSA